MEARWEGSLCPAKGTAMSSSYTGASSAWATCPLLCGHGCVVGKSLTETRGKQSPLKSLTPHTFINSYWFISISHGKETEHRFRCSFLKSPFANWTAARCKWLLFTLVTKGERRHLYSAEWQKWSMTRREGLQPQTLPSCGAVYPHSLCTAEWCLVFSTWLGPLGHKAGFPASRREPDLCQVAVGE